MPGVARKDGRDRINTRHGCDTETVTDTGSGNVFVNNIGVVRKGDLTKVHLIPKGILCVSHQPRLTSYSPTVFANNLNIGRLGDDYEGEVLITASNNVFANGGGSSGDSGSGGGGSKVSIDDSEPTPGGGGGETTTSTSTTVDPNAKTKYNILASTWAKNVVKGDTIVLANDPSSTVNRGISV